MNESPQATKAKKRIEKDFEKRDQELQKMAKQLQTLQEALEKIAALSALPLVWHYIGPIQSNKTRDIAAHFDWVHSVAREKIALRLARQGREGSPIGTTLVLGDTEELAPYLRQLILNPLHGHPAELRRLDRPGLFETLRELAAAPGPLAAPEEEAARAA